MKRQYGVLCVGLAVLASGCSNNNTSKIDTAVPSALPPTPAPITPAQEDNTVTDGNPAKPDSPAKTPTDADLDAATVLKKFFNECLPAAEQEPLQARKHLRPCAGGPQLDVAAPSVLEYHQQGWQMRGITKVGTPQVQRLSATDVDVRTCLDESDVTTWDAATGELIVTGEAATPKLFRLRHTDTGWLVWATTTIEDQRQEICR